MAFAQLGKLKIGGGEPVRIMGIINASAESFYSGSVVREADEALRRVESWARFVDIIDVGGMSTAPYKHTWVTQDEEARRVTPIIRALAQNFDIPISVDTYRPRVAEEAIKAGAVAINDVTGLKMYPEMCKVAKDYDVALILMARERAPKAGVDPIDRVIEALKESIDLATKCGVEPDKIIVDPGIGFPVLPPRDEPYVVQGELRHGDPNWPWWRWDSYIIANLERLRQLGRPILIGVSRKTFIRRIVGASSPEEVLPGSVAAEAIAVLNGADVVRTHNPPETWQAVRIAEVVRNFKLEKRISEI